MKRLPDYLPALIVMAAAAALLVHGPIAQPAGYHDFADHSTWAGLPHAADVVSNLGFAVVGLLGWMRLRPWRHHPALAAGWPGYRLFLVALVLTSAGSWFYHLDPDNVRLVWDRLPIAIACAGLLAAVGTETRPAGDPRTGAALLALLAVVSVAWWHFTGLRGIGDLRPYLMLQVLPMVLIPLWQALRRAPGAERAAFAAAIVLYALAKAAELHDHELLARFGWISGHTLKHLLATAAAAVVVGRLLMRVRSAVAADGRAGLPAPPSQDLEHALGSCSHR